MELELYDAYDIAWVYLSALISGDWSGLDMDETRRLRRFINGVESRAAHEGCTRLTWTTNTDEAFFAIDAVSGLMADCNAVGVYKS